VNEFNKTYRMKLIRVVCRTIKSYTLHEDDHALALAREFVDGLNESGVDFSDGEQLIIALNALLDICRDYDGYPLAKRIAWFFGTDMSLAEADIRKKGRDLLARLPHL